MIKISDWKKVGLLFKLIAAVICGIVIISISENALIIYKEIRILDVFICLVFLSLCIYSFTNEFVKYTNAGKLIDFQQVAPGEYEVTNVFFDQYGKPEVLVMKNIKISWAVGCVCSLPDSLKAISVGENITIISVPEKNIVGEQ